MYNIKNILLKNSFYGVAQSILSSILILVSIPIFIHYLGPQQYGIFALYMVVGNLNVLVSAGFSSPIVKYVSEQGISNSSSVDITIGLSILSFLSLLFLTFSILFDKFIIVDVLNIPPDIYISSVWLYYWLILSNFFLLIGQAFKAVIDGLQKSYLSSIHQFIYNLTYWLSVLAGIIYGADLNTIGFLIFISSLIWFVITLATARFLYGPFLHFDSIDSCKDSLIRQFSFGSKIFAGGSIFVLFEPLSKILVSQYVGIVYVGYYDIALKVKGQVGALFARLYYPLFPLFSKENNLNLIRFYVHDIEQKSFIFLAPLVVSLTFVLKPLFDMWLDDAEIIYLSALYLLTVSLVTSAATPIYHFLVAKGHASKTIYMQALNTVTNLTFFLITVDSLGYFAIILANSLALMSSFLLSIFYQYKYLNSLVFDSLAQFFRFLLVLLLLFIFAYFVDQLFISFTYFHLFIIPFATFILSFILFSFSKIICRHDIIRYIGTNKVSLLINKFMRA